MSDWNLPWEGGCRCGQVRFRISQPPLLYPYWHQAGFAERNPFPTA